MSDSSSFRPAVVFLLSSLLGLSGCIGGSSSSSEEPSDDAERIDDTISENGQLQSIDGADSQFLFFTKEYRIDDVVGAQPSYLVGVNPATADRVMVTPGPQNNFLERAEKDEAFRVPLTENRPDPSTLPLAVKTGDYEPTGAIGDVRFGYVVYNTPEGELYRAAVDPADDGSVQVDRISSEQNAEVVCAAKVLPDFENPDLSVIVYQAAKNGQDCSLTAWRMVRLQQASNDEPFTLRDEVAYDDGFIPPANFVPEDGEPLQGLREHWSFAMRNKQGGLTGILTFDGDDAENLKWHDPVQPDASETVLPDIDTWVRPLGIAGSAGKTIIQADGLVYALSEQGEGNARLINMNSEETTATNEEAVEFSLTGPDQAVNLDGIMYVVDVVDGSQDTGRVLAIDPDKGDEQVEILADNDNWGTGTIVSNVTGSNAGDGFLSWAYRPEGCDDDDCKGAIQSLNLTSGTSVVVKEDIEYDFPYRIQSPAAPNTETPLVFYEDTIPNAVGAIGLNGLGDNYEISPSNWLGQSWSRQVPSAGRQASYVYFADRVDNQFGGVSYVLKARPAENIDNSEDITFDSSPDQSSESEVSVQGYGSTVLFSFMLRDGITHTALSGSETLNSRKACSRLLMTRCSTQGQYHFSKCSANALRG